MHDIDLMLQLQLEGRWQEARAISDKLENQGPEKIIGPDGVAGNKDTWFRHCFNRGWFLLQDGNYQMGSQLLEHGRYLNTYGGGFLKTPAPIYNPAEHDIKNKSIIVSLEGGYGDEIITARFAASFKKLGAAKVYLACAPELCSLLSRISGVDGVILRNQSHTVAHDYWVPGFSAGWVAGHTYADLPGQSYLTALPQSVELWKNIVKSDKKKIGIRWAGNPKFEHQQFRRFPEQFLLNLAQHPELQLYSLQRDHNTVSLPESIVDLQHLLLSWEDTAAAIMNLDLVITSCTSIAHLSAALGKETWVVVPILPYHTWAYRSPEYTKSPYYNSVTLFRQQKPGKWNDTFQDLYANLQRKFDLAPVELPNEDKPVNRVNLGCGFDKHKGFLNVDVSPEVNPDQIANLNQFPWPWADNEFDHVVASHILEHLGETSEDFVKIISEMYRISKPGAIWEISLPHWRCDTALDDPTHKRLITQGMFTLFNQPKCYNAIKQYNRQELLCFDSGVDLEICDVQFEFLDHWKQKLNNKEITQDELYYALNTFNNVAVEMKVLLQVHKPGRIDVKLVKDLLKNK